MQTDLELFRDWCGLINHGMKVTPVGSSDSHDVTRYIVGQGRTYIAADDKDVSKLDTAARAGFPRKGQSHRQLWTLRTPDSRKDPRKWR